MQHDSSFRDPAGYIFVENSRVLRAIRTSGRANFEEYVSSGLHAALVKARLSVDFERVAPPPSVGSDVYAVIAPTQIPFISYPYEWSFSMLRAAAALTLRVQNLALQHGFSLKDASAYNVQFLNGKPIFIDTLSFEKYVDGAPWIAYRQFCQHFIAPLAICSALNPELIRLLSIYIDGVPLDTAWQMLPLRAKWHLGNYTHLYLHSKSQQKHEASRTAIAAKQTTFSRRAFGFLIDNLQKTVENARLPPAKSEWNDYTNISVHAAAYTAAKSERIQAWLREIEPKTVWDLGANTGTYSRIAAAEGAQVVAFDGDARCIEDLYLSLKSEKNKGILPLYIDLANPSPALGWAHTERAAWADRPRPEMLFALALVHHLAISNHLPFERIAAFFADLTRFLIIEFVPRTDPKVVQLLLNRRDAAEHYSEAAFRAAFEAHFMVKTETVLPPDGRILFLMEKKI